MRREDIDRFLTPSARRAAEEFLHEVDESRESDDFDLAEVLDRNLAEAMTAYDPDAAVARFLSLRFLGEKIDGRLPEQIIEEVLPAFRKELAGAAPTSSQADLQLDLVGFSRGSAILHLAPAKSANIPARDLDSQQSLASAADHIDKAVGVVAELHDAAESGQDMQRFACQGELVKAFILLSDALDRHQVDLDLTWRARSGARRRTRLTRIGRSHVREYLVTRNEEEVRLLSGRVIALNISGSFSLKTGRATNSPRYDINAGGETQLLELNLRLGQTVTVQIRRRTQQDKLGFASKERLELITLVHDEEPLYE